MMLFSSRWVFFYLIQLLLLSLALGSWAVHQPRWLMVPRLSRFLIGFCATPFVLGAWMLFLAAILPGASRWLFLIPPLALAILQLIFYSRRTLHRLIRNYQRTWRATKISWPAYLIYAGIIFIMALVTHRLVLNGRLPVVGQDALEYLGEALPFVQERSLSATTNFRDWPDGTIVGSVHNFMWPAFLGHALMTTGNNPPGYPYDQAARVAFQVTFIYMLLSVLALAGTARYPGMGPLAILLLLQVPKFESISSNQSRDAFWIIPLMLLATILTGLSPPRLRLKLRFTSLLPPLILAAFSLSGHTLAGVTVVLMSLAWLLWNILHKAGWLNLLLVLGAIAGGLLLGGFHYFEAYLETGNFRGYPSVPPTTGTPLEDIILQAERDRIATAPTTTQHLAILLAGDQYRLSVLGVLGAIFAVVWWVRFKWQRGFQSIPLIGLIVLVTLLPFIGLLDYKNYRLSEWLISNFRYTLHWYPFAAVGVAILVGYAYQSRMSRQTKLLRALATGGLLLFTVVVSFSAGKTIITEWSITPRGEEWVVKNIRPLETVIHQMPAERRVLLEDRRYNYYLGNQAVIMYTRPTWEIIRARNESEVQSALSKLNIGAVILEEANLSGWWDQTPLFNYLSNPKTAFVADRNSRLRTYIVDETLVRRQQELAETTAKNAMRAVQLDLDSTATIETEGDKTYLVARTGQKVVGEGPVYLAEGRIEGSKALVIEGTTRLTGPPSVINLSQGSLSVWARLTDPAKQYSDLVRVNNSNDLYIYHQAAGGFTALYNGINLGNSWWGITDDQWHHYVFTWQDGEQAFYIDGLQALSAEVPASEADVELFAIGWLGDGTDREKWGGLLANLTTFDRLLSADEVAALYQVRLSTDD